MESPKPKRHRLSLNNPHNPYIPLEHNLSPFHDASQDVIDHIFRCLTDTRDIFDSDMVGNTKTKMRLELVCMKFRRRITENTCWTMDRNLKLMYYRYQQSDLVAINNSEFNSSIASKALAIFLQRVVIREVKLTAIKWPIYLAFDIQTQIIRYGQSFPLRKVKFDYDVDADVYVLDISSAILLNGLAACDLSNLKIVHVEVCGGDGCDEHFETYFWSFISRCPNLSCLKLRVTEGTGMYDNIDQLIACCTRIETLEIADFSHHDDKLVLLLELLSNLQGLKSLFMVLGGVEIEVINLLDDATRSRIETLKLELNLYADNEEYTEFIVLIPTLFPNLKKFEPEQHYDTSKHCWNATVSANLIQNIANEYSGHGSREFTLGMRVRHADKETFIQLITAMDIIVVPDSENYHLFKCYKNDLVIILDLHYNY